jgi:large subunit ribosomal protein L4
MENKIFVQKSTENETQDTNRKKKAIGLIHRVYLTQLINSRKYLASTKTKSEVRGGGRKPWKQKGTGKARAGSLRSPLFVGGGVIFGPKPRTVIKKVNKKERRLALLSAFSLKKNQLKFIDEKVFSEFSSIKTKEIVNLLSSLNFFSNSKILFILSKPNKYFWLSSKNIKNVEITTASCVNLKQILTSKYIVLSQQSLELINSTFGKQYE